MSEKETLEGLAEFKAYFGTAESARKNHLSADSLSSCDPNSSSFPSTPAKKLKKKSYATFSSSEDHEEEEDWQDSSNEGYYSRPRRAAAVKNKKSEPVGEPERKATSSAVGVFSGQVISPLATDFHRACQFGHVATLESMIRKGEVFDINQLDSLRNTGLHEAAVQGHWEVVRLLLKHGASVNVENLAGKTPIDLAQSPSMAAFMKEFGVRSGTAGLHSAINSVWQNDLIALRTEYTKRSTVSLFDDEDELGYTAVHAAALFDRIDFLKFFASHGANLEKASSSGITPLHEACRFSSPEAVRFLLEHGVDMRITNLFGHMPFAMANKVLRRTFRRIAKERKLGLEDFDDSVPFVHFEDESEVSDVDASDEDGEIENAGVKMPLFNRPVGLSREERKLQQTLAIMNKLSPVKQQSQRPTQRTKSDESLSTKRSKSMLDFDEDDGLLVETIPQPKHPKKVTGETTNNDSRPLDYRDKYGSTVLHRLASKGNVKEIRKVLRKAPELVDVVDNAGYSPLHEAALAGHLPAVRTLLDAGANIDLASLDGDTALHDAAENGHEEVVLYLLHAGANRILKNSQGKTADEVALDDRTRLVIKAPKTPVSLAIEKPSTIAQRREKKTVPSVKGEVKRKPGRPRKDEKKGAATSFNPPVSPVDPIPLALRTPQPIPDAESCGPLLLVSIGEPHGWFFLSPQIERLFIKGLNLCDDKEPSVVSTDHFHQAHPDLFHLALSDLNRQHLLLSHIVERLPELKTSLVLAGQSPDHPLHLLEKDSVYSAFSSHGLAFGNIKVLYVDLQRILRTSLSNSNLTNAATVQSSTTTHSIPPKLKMKMARKGSGAGITEDHSPATLPITGNPSASAQLVSSSSAAAPS